MPDRFLTQSSDCYKPSSSDNAIKIEPSSTIRFESIQPGTVYTTPFILRNTTNTAQRIRIEPPKRSFFSLKYLPGTVIAPGLTVRAEITCHIPHDSKEFVFTETITASMGSNVVDIPIYASKVSARIEFEDYVNLGCATNGDKELTKEILFENKGEIAGTVEFRMVEDSKMKVRPMKFELAPHGTKTCQQKLRISFREKDVGVRREAIQVVVTGGSSAHSSLQVTAEIVRPKLSLLGENNKGLLDFFDFGALFYGEQKKATAVLANNCPQALSYSISYGDEEEKNPQTDDNPSISLIKCLLLSPSDGIIKPYSEIVLSLSFKPEMNQLKNGFEKQFILDVKEPSSVMRKVFVDCPEIDQRILLNLQGKW
jgi:hypothetical protein